MTIQQIEEIITQIEEIDAMPAGLELDLLIAMHVFGRRREDMTYKLADGIEHISLGPSGPADYSTDIAAAWRVVEKLNLQHPLVLTFRPQAKDWWVMLPDEARHPKGRLRHGPDCMVQAFAETAPLAICRAALKAVCSINIERGLTDEEATIDRTVRG